jgi:hypothetical protein
MSHNTGRAAKQTEEERKSVGSKYIEKNKQKGYNRKCKIDRRTACKETSGANQKAYRRHTCRETRRKGKNKQDGYAHQQTSLQRSNNRPYMHVNSCP